MQCPNCKAWMPDERRFCTNCGKLLVASEAGDTNVHANETNHVAGQRPVIVPQTEANDAVGIGAWIGVFVLLTIPVVNVIMCLIWAFGAQKRSLKNFARATIICTLIVLILAVVTGILLAISGESISFSFAEQLF